MARAADSAPAEAGAKAGTMLYVGGLDEGVDEALVRAAFVPFGNVKEVNLPMDPESTGHRGFAFVMFEDEDDAAEATFNMDGAELRGRTLKVNEARAAQGAGGRPAWEDADKWYARQGVSEAGGSGAAKRQQGLAAEAAMLREGPAAGLAKGESAVRST